MQIFPTYKQSKQLALLLLLFGSIACSSNNVPIYESAEFCVFSDKIVQGDYSSRVIDATGMVSNYINKEEVTWELTADLDQFPVFKSNYDILNTNYLLSLEELHSKLTGDSLLSAQNLNVFDLGYSTVLSLAILCPEVCMNDLMQCVKNGRIVQNNGTGGSWPISSDRVIWSVAAWEIYKMTGDNDWLRKAYFIIKNSIDDDLNVIWDFKQHLFRGESAFLNWREQSYPDWMEPIDIFESFSLSTQMVHYQSLQSLIGMGKLLGKDVQKYIHVSDALQKSVNKKFRDNNNKLCQFIYKSSNLVSIKKDILGESLSRVWNILNYNEIMQNDSSLSPFGVPCFYPQSKNLPNYHNNCSWPFVQGFWNWQQAKDGNLNNVLYGIACSLRSTSLFLTNKANFLLESGDFNGTEQNHDADLKSLSASLSNYFHVLLGISTTSQHMALNPNIPRPLKGQILVTGLKYRNAILDIEILGFGSRINSFTFDGTPYRKAIIPKDIEGHHKVVIKMNNQAPNNKSYQFANQSYSPKTPVVAYKQDELQWNKMEGISHYKIFQNGELLLETKDNYMTDVHIDEPVQYHVQAVDTTNNHSYLSKPLWLFDSKYETFLEAENFQRNAKNNYILLEKNKQEPFYFQVKSSRNGKYRINFIYANGNGPIDDGDKCAIRSLWQNNGYLGSIVFPQRGKDNWNDYGNSNSFTVNLKKGYNFFKITYEDFNSNMNGTINSVRLDKIRLLRLQ